MSVSPSFFNQKFRSTEDLPFTFDQPEGLIGTQKSKPLLADDRMINRSALDLPRFSEIENSILKLGKIYSGLGQTTPSPPARKATAASLKETEEGYTLPAPSPERASFVKSQKRLAEWNGMVTEIGADTFAARLFGVFGEGVKDLEQEATIPVQEVSEEDRFLLRPGAYFRLCVLYARENKRQKRETSIVFRRLPAYRQVDLDAARDRAIELLNGIRVE